MAKVIELNSAASLWRRDVQEVNDEPSMTRQEMSDDCDINVIMKRYERTGMLPFNATQPPAYLDLTMTPPDLMTAMNLMNNAESAFMSLPANVRKEFDNDPMRFVEFASDAQNIERMREFGLAPPAPVEPAPIRVELANPPEPEARSPEGKKPAGA
uniref:Minor capsid protein n=1 Tax=Gokushovirinae environmental samples TaxID=1478972 RepID=A0A2R3UAI9_9VIRU|nr:minor capsid protein [Gokushovirinae environmental samples]